LGWFALDKFVSWQKRKEVAGMLPFLFLIFVVMTIHEEQVLAYLECIRRNLSVINYDALVREIGRLVPHLPFSEPKLQHLNNEAEQYSDLNKVYRSRVNKFQSNRSTSKLPFNRLDEIGLVPISERSKIGRGRCNKPGEAMFYASFTFATAAAESLTKGLRVNQESNISYTISEWVATEQLKVALINYSIITLKEQEFYLGPKWNEKQQKEHKERVQMCLANREGEINHLVQLGYSPEFSQNIVDFFTHEFGKTLIQNSDDYKISNCFVDRIFNDRESFDAIIYPSLQFTYCRDNIVIHPKAMHKMKFSSAMFVGHHYFPAQAKTQFVPWEQRKVANEEGKILWNQFAHSDQDREEYIKSITYNFPEQYPNTSQ
jgi:hypothetical protein